MLKLSQTILKYSFTIVPERASRYFNLTIQTHLEYPISDILKEQHQKHIQQYEDKGALLMAFEKNKEKDKKTVDFIYLFQSPNEIEAHQFMKQIPFKDYLKTYEIEEFQMQSRVRDKQLAPKNLRQ